MLSRNTHCCTLWFNQITKHNQTRTMEESILFQGAEAKIYLKNHLGKVMLVKERFPKKYRNPVLDNSLTKERIKAECRNIMRCKQAGVKTPAIYSIDMENRRIYMEYVQNSITTKQLIDNLQKEKTEISKEKMTALAENIGKNIAKMHSTGIVHGDLTTSNILIADNELVFIDFGLSSSNSSAEDKGVDLYVLERALLSTHANVEKLFSSILDAYKELLGARGVEIIKKFEEVRARGRKRTMIG